MRLTISTGKLTQTSLVIIIMVMTLVTLMQIKMSMIMVMKNHDYDKMRTHVPMNHTVVYVILVVIAVVTSVLELLHLACSQVLKFTEPPLQLDGPWQQNPTRPNPPPP